MGYSGIYFHITPLKKVNGNTFAHYNYIVYRNINKKHLKPGSFGLKQLKLRLITGQSLM